MFHKIETNKKQTHKIVSQKWESQKCFSKLRLTKNDSQIETHKNDSQIENGYSQNEFKMQS